MNSLVRMFNTQKEMPKINFIGAGSFGFTRKLVRDLLSFPELEASEIVLIRFKARFESYAFT